MKVPRFHSGGVARLNPGEVPAILSPSVRYVTREHASMLETLNTAMGGESSEVTVIVNGSDLETMLPHELFAKYGRGPTR